MQQELDLNRSNFNVRTISPYQEMGAYEFLWTKRKTTFKSLSSQFTKVPRSIPSDFVEDKTATIQCAESVMNRFEKAQVGKFGVRINGGGEYPERLRDASFPIQFFYYQGWWDLASSPTISVIGTRNPTNKGLARARQVVRDLVNNDFTIVSGLAAGIDSTAHRTAIEENGRTIAVIGTPLSHVYPKENSELQEFIARNHLIISQVPVLRYESQDYRFNRFFFQERNATMSALTSATVVIEAGERSGTLIQARAAIKQNRKLFILDSCFRDTQITWPDKFEKNGALRVRSIDDIQKHLTH